MTTLHKPNLANGCEFMRYQVHINGTRPLMEPEFRGKLCVGYSETNRRIPVTQVIGFGETEAQAVAMAKKHSKCPKPDFINT